MGFIPKIIILLYFCGIVYGLGNISSFLRSFDRNLSKIKDVCYESVNYCTKLNTVLTNSTCFDMQLNYDYTYENTNYNLNLDNWTPLQAIPICWNYLQKLLCSIKYPECVHLNSNWLVKKTAKEVCIVTIRECPFLISQNRENNNSKSIENQYNGIYALVYPTPVILECDRYVSNCFIDKRMIQIKDQTNCKWPMVKTTEHSLWIKGFSKCSFHCQTPFFSKEEYQHTKSIFGVLGIIFFLLNIIVLTTLILHQMQHNKYYWHPLLLNLFIFHFYMLLSTIGWMMPLMPSVGHSIVCRADGALQIRKPQVKVGEAIWCVITFSIVYFPLMAGSITSISFFYSVFSVVKNYANCCLNKDDSMDNYSSNKKSFKLPFFSKKMGFTIRKFDDKINKRNQNIELKAMKSKIKDAGFKFRGNGFNLEYSIARNHTLSGQVYVILISVALLVFSLTVAEIRADPVSGICFISSEFITTRILLSLFPLTIFLIIKSVIIYFVIKHFKTIQKHLTIYTSCQQEIHSKRISRTSRFYVFILLFLWTFWSFSVYTHWYIFVNESLWYGALTKSFLCKLQQSLLLHLPIFGSDSEPSICPLETKPIINVFILHNFSYFSLNIVYIICTLFNKHFLLVWKKQFSSCTRLLKEDETSRGTMDSKNIYPGLQNQTLLDALWNPGVFVYLVKTKHVSDQSWTDRVNDKQGNTGSVEDSSASYYVYHQDGSMRSCVSMPPIKAASGQNVCRLFQDFPKDSPRCTTLGDFIKGNQSSIGDNSIRRCNSFEVRPYLNCNSCAGNLNIPFSSRFHGSENQFKSSANDNVINCQQKCNRPGCCCTMNQNLFQHNCLSLNQISHLRNSASFVDKRRKKSTRRLSMFLDHHNGVSLRSSLNRHKQARRRYSVSTKSLSKTINHQSSILSHHIADPASCHSSSFSAESYNSYNLMAQQMGGRWRDICRTRMTLHDAMMWAKTASNYNYHNPMCSHVSMCNHQHCDVLPQTTCPNYSRTSNISNVSTSQVDQNVLTHDLSSDCCEAPEKDSYYLNPDNMHTPAKSGSLKGSKNSQMSISFNDSSDEFNSEDEVVSTGNSIKSSCKESGEFCSEDEVVSLINSNN